MEKSDKELISVLEKRCAELEWKIDQALNCGSRTDLRMDGSSRWRLTLTDVEKVRRFLEGRLSTYQQYLAEKEYEKKYGKTP